MTTFFEMIYQCKIEPTGEILNKIIEFPIPIKSTEKITYMKEREMSIKFSESQLKKFLNDYDNYCMIINAMQEHPHVKSEVEKLIILVKLIS